MDKKKLYALISILSGMVVIIAVVAFFLFTTSIIHTGCEKETPQEEEASETEAVASGEEEKEEESEKVDTGQRQLLQEILPLQLTGARMTAAEPGH
jgi:uncharacterized membrane protein